jgi:hypothetical protein
MALERKEYKISINAPREKVWNILWDDKTYREWTAAFHPSSHAISNWNEGDKVLFLGEGGSGMVSRIARKIDNEYMSFEHLGEVKNGVEDTTSERVKQWAGSHENYTLKDNNGHTDVIVDIDLSGEFVEMFNEMWPKALAKLKEVAER